MYSTGLPEASYCAYKGIGPSAVVNSTTCTRRDGTKEVPMEALAAHQPKVLYILLGTNVLNRDDDYSNFLTYYRLMLDMVTQTLPNTQIYVQSITPVRPDVRATHPGLYKERLCEINNELAASRWKELCLPQSVGSPRRRKRRSESRVRPEGRLPRQARRLHRLGRLPPHPYRHHDHRRGGVNLQQKILPVV